MKELKQRLAKLESANNAGGGGSRFQKSNKSGKQGRNRGNNNNSGSNNNSSSNARGNSISAKLNRTCVMYNSTGSCDQEKTCKRVHGCSRVKTDDGGKQSLCWAKHPVYEHQ